MHLAPPVGWPTRVSATALATETTVPAIPCDTVCMMTNQSVTLTLTLDRVKDMSTYTVHVGNPHAQPRDCSIMQYINTAIWISWNIDIRQSLNSRDSFLGRKFENRTPTSCRPRAVVFAWWQIHKFSHFDRTLACDGQTWGHSIYRASIGSNGNKTHTQPFYTLFWDHLGEPEPKEIFFWTLRCNWR